MVYLDYLLILWLIFFSVKKRFIEYLSKGPLLGLFFFLVPIIFYFYKGFIKFQLFLVYVIYIFFVMFFVTLMLVNYDKTNFKVKPRIIQKIIRNSIAITILLLLLFPINRLKYPLGDYLVGTNSVILELGHRKDPINKKLKRVNRLRKFYPIDKKGVNRSKVLSYNLKFSEVKKINFLKGIFYNYLSKREINSYNRTELTERKDDIPVIIVSHKPGLFGEYYIGLCERLASKGNYVIMINHTYFSEFTKINEKIYEEEIENISNNIYDNKKVIKNANETDKYVSIYKNDILDAMNYIEKINNESYMFRLDTNNITLVGHEMSGRAALELVSDDHRISKVIAIDPLIPNIKENFEKEAKILIFQSEDYLVDKNKIINQLNKNKKGEFKILTIKKSDTMDFTSIQYYLPFSNILNITENSNIDIVDKEIEMFLSEIR